ncbi:MAG: type II toxin-antitoxin system Phd/YefM family antitoxin [Spirochaetales bacterium]
MSTITLFEAKAQISELVKRIASSGESVVLTVRGKPMVRIIPYREETPPDVWELRERSGLPYGSIDFEAPARSTEVRWNPLDELP